MTNTTEGFVYILTSKNCDCLKIGGSSYPPLKRIKEINACEPYRSLGQWHLADFRQVSAWRDVEYQLHYQFRDLRNKQISGQKELFHVSLFQASQALSQINEKFIIKKPKVDRLFNHVELKQYLQTLISWAGLTHWLDYQGAWTLTLFPSTNGGRYFTINIGGHEVAYSTLSKRHQPSIHMLLMDELITDTVEAMNWLERREGSVERSPYKTSLDRAVCVYFTGDFATVYDFLALPNVRRAIIAYWQEVMFMLKDTAKISAYARHHDYNAVAKLVK